MESSENIIRGTQWQAQEDILLLEIIALEGTGNWKRIQEYFPGRSVSGCRRRWYRLRGSEETSSSKRCPNCKLPFRSETKIPTNTWDPPVDTQPLIKELLTPSYVLPGVWPTSESVITLPDIESPAGTNHKPTNFDWPSGGGCTEEARLENP
jgi:hypothetical protein